jgi:serine/threonine protein kinase
MPLLLLAYAGGALMLLCRPPYSRGDLDLTLWDFWSHALGLLQVRVLAKMNHPHVIKYLGSFREGAVLNIVTELAESGSLYDMIKKRKGTSSTLPEPQIWKYFVQTALALQHIHSHRILHRDVKTMNIFLTRGDDVKVGDLGVARVLSDTMDMANTMVGTPYYLSPELCEGKPYNDKSDVWSLGKVLSRLLMLTDTPRSDHWLTCRERTTLSMQVVCCTSSAPCAIPLTHKTRAPSSSRSSGANTPLFQALFPRNSPSS